MADSLNRKPSTWSLRRIRNLECHFPTPALNGFKNVHLLFILFDLDCWQIGWRLLAICFAFVAIEVTVLWCVNVAINIRRIMDVVNNAGRFRLQPAVTNRTERIQ